jgi:hypothetical protein
LLSNVYNSSFFVAVLVLVVAVLDVSTFAVAAVVADVDVFRVVAAAAVVAVIAVAAAVVVVVLVVVAAAVAAVFASVVVAVSVAVTTRDVWTKLCLGVHIELSFRTACRPDYCLRKASVMPFSLQITLKIPYKFDGYPQTMDPDIDNGLLLIQTAIINFPLSTNEV